MRILREQGHAEMLLWLFESRIKKTGKSAQVFREHGCKIRLPTPLLFLERRWSAHVIQEKNMLVVV